MNDKEIADFLRSQAAALEAQAKQMREKAEQLCQTGGNISPEKKPITPENTIIQVPPRDPSRPVRSKRSLDL